MPFILIFILIPFVELATFASVSEHIGIWTTLLFAFATAIIGGMIVKHQGLQTVFSMRQSMDSGKMPVTEIFDGFCLVAAGALLITPGFVTDSIGFALLIPPVRAALRAFLKKYTKIGIATHAAEGFRGQPRRPHDPDIIEGEYERVDEDKP